MIAVLAVFMVLCGAIPRFIRYFEQENLLLPQVSQHTFTLSHRMNTHWYVIIPAFLLFDGCMLLGLQVLRRPWRFLARVWSGAVLLAAVLLLAYCFLGAAIPMDETFRAPHDLGQNHEAMDADE